MMRFLGAAFVVAVLAFPALAQQMAPSNPNVEATMLAYRQLGLSIDGMMKGQGQDIQALQKQIADWRAYFTAYVGKEPAK